jgi:hypothetical protein
MWGVLRNVLLYISWVVTNSLLLGTLLFGLVSRALQEGVTGKWHPSVAEVLLQYGFVFGMLVGLQALFLRLWIRSAFSSTRWLLYWIANTVGWAFFGCIVSLSGRGTPTLLLSGMAIVSIVLAQSIFIVGGIQWKRWLITWVCICSASVGMIYRVPVFLAPWMGGPSEWWELVPGGLYGASTGVILIWFSIHTVQLSAPVFLHRAD